MTGNFIVERENRHSSDPFLLSVIVLLLGIGLTFLFSASYPNALRLHKAPELFLLRQAVMAAHISASFCHSPAGRTGYPGRQALDYNRGQVFSTF